MHQLKFGLSVLLSLGSLYSILSVQFGENMGVINAGAVKSPENISFSISQNLPPHLFPLVHAPPVGNNTFPQGMALSSSEASNTTNSTNNFRVVSGKWELTANGVQAGDDLLTLNNVMVKPVLYPSERLDIYTSFTIDRLPPRTASYISLVHSWINSENYKFAGITLYDNQIYAHFGTILDGVLTFDPPWPGSRMNLDADTGELMRMLLAIRGGSQELNVNGFEASKEGSINNNGSGYIGLSNGRVEDVVFHNLDIFKR